MNPEELEKLSIIELKALVYDQMVQVETSQKNIGILNTWVAKKLQPIKPDEA